MVNQNMIRAVETLHRWAAMEAERKSDAALVTDFVQSREEAAFRALVERHGAMVWQVCRRVLGNDHDADDAFQATFLVLAQKAAAVRKRTSLGSWLHGVAYRVANKSKARSLRECEAIRAVAKTEAGLLADDVSWREVRTVLDDELQRLPEHYRAPLVLCYLQGKTRDEAAQELGWSVSTLRGRLERGRAQLRRRLVQRGLSLSAPLVAATLASDGQGAAPKVVLTTETTRRILHSLHHSESNGLSNSVILLAEGALRAMFLTRIKTATVVCAVVVLAALILPGARYFLNVAVANPPIADPSVARQTAANIEKPIAARAGKLHRLQSKFTRVEVRQLYPVLATGDPGFHVKKRRVTKPKQIAALQAFFPKLGEQRDGAKRKIWRDRFVLQFFRKNGTSVRIAVSETAEEWSEGADAWRAQNGLWMHLAKLLGDENEIDLIKLQGTWNHFTEEVNGRPILYTGPRRFPVEQLIIKGRNLVRVKNEKKHVTLISLVAGHTPKLMVLFSFDASKRDDNADQLPRNALYELKQNDSQLWICTRNVGNQAPTTIKGGKGMTLRGFVRAKSKPGVKKR